MSKPLTAKQKLFVKEYTLDKNATQSAIRAGYSKHTAQKIGSENLSKPVIAQAIDKEMTKAMKKIDEAIIVVHKTKAEWLARVEDIAFSDLTEMFARDKNGKLTMSLSDIKDRKIGHLIKKIKVHQNGSIEVDLKNDQHALELIAKHQGWIADQVNIGVPGAPQDLSKQDFKSIFSDPKVTQLALQLAEATCKPAPKGEKEKK
jgi:phage terminase small subunit